MGVSTVWTCLSTTAIVTVATSHPHGLLCTSWALPVQVSRRCSSKVPGYRNVARRIVVLLIFQCALIIDISIFRLFIVTYGCHQNPLMTNPYQNTHPYPVHTPKASSFVLYCIPHLTMACILSSLRMFKKPSGLRGCARPPARLAWGRLGRNRKLSFFGLPLEDQYQRPVLRTDRKNVFVHSTLLTTCRKRQKACY